MDVKEILGARGPVASRLPAYEERPQQTQMAVEVDRVMREGGRLLAEAGTGVAHAFRAGQSGMTLTAWGTREPNDICWYPRSQKIYWRGVDVVGRIEQLDYWDGEALE